MDDAVVRLARDSPANGPLSDSREIHSTPPSSPTKYVQSTTPQSTPLHRRFLKEVSMSPGTPATPTTPATPPRTPSRARQATPSQDRARPTKGGSASGRCRNSPAKLEIGQNGFYFSCEIPRHKITPKKQTTPQKSSRAGTPMQRPPSPLKNETPVKRGPARVLFGKPRRATADVAKGQTGTLTTSPSRVSGRVDRKEANDVPSGLISPSRVVRQEVPKSSTEQANLKLHPENIGCMMARLGSGSFKTHDWTNADNSVDPIKSPVPTPLRQAFQKLYATAPPSLKLEADQCEVTVKEPTKNIDTSEPCPLQEKCFDQEKRVMRPIDDSRGTKACSERNPVGAKAFTASPSKNDNIQDELSEQHSSCSSALAFHQTTTPEQEPKVVAFSDCLDKHVQQRGLRASPAKSKNEPTNHRRRLGTDPKVLLAIQKDMASIGGKFRRSFEPVPSVGRTNTNEVPKASNVIVAHELDTAKRRVGSAPKARGRLMRCTSDTPAVCTPPPSTSGLAGARERAVTMIGMGMPQWNPGRAISAQPRRDSSAAAKETELKTVKPKRELAAPPRLRPITTALTKPSKPAVKSTGTPHRQPRASGITTTHARPQVSGLAKRQTPTAAIAKGPTIPPATSRSKPRVKIPSPTSHALPTLRTPTLTRKPALKTPRSTTVLRTVKSQPALPCDPSIISESYKEQFVDAAEIADRIKQWHNEDLEKTKSVTTFAIPASTLAATTPSKTTHHSPTTLPDASPPAESTQSTTPPGSPLKPPVPPPSAATIAPPPRPTPKLAAATPKKSASPRQPRLRPSAPPIVVPTDPATLSRFPGNPRTPHTPANSRIATIDRNAFRTPSKAIESSLDRAIDEKLREDARRGMEFTPGGQKIRELLGGMRVE